MRVRVRRFLTVLADEAALFLCHGDRCPVARPVGFIAPILAAAHCCWANAKTIAVYEWARGIQARERAAGRALILEERPQRGSVQAKDAETNNIVASLQADASFPVDGTGMTIQLLTGERF